MLLPLINWFAIAISLLAPAFAAIANSSLYGALPASLHRELSLNTTISAKTSNVSHDGLIQIADASEFPNKWRGEATIETYMESEVFSSVGYITGPMMYDMVQRTLKADCPDTVGGHSQHKCWGKWFALDTSYRMDNGKIAPTLVQVHVKTSYYTNIQVRNLLIGALAAAYEESTKLMRNCFHADDAEAGFIYCNAPVQVGVYTEDSHVLMELRTDIDDDNDGSWHCCETREFVDRKLDELVGELKSVYPTPRGKVMNVECHLGCAEDQRESNIDVDKVLIDIMNSGL